MKNVVVRVGAKQIGLRGLYGGVASVSVLLGACGGIDPSPTPIAIPSMNVENMGVTPEEPMESTPVTEENSPEPTTPVDAEPEPVAALPTAILVEAESGVLGAELSTVDDAADASLTYVTGTANVLDAPLTVEDSQVSTLEVLFPKEGEYQVYARVRIGPEAAEDDSFYLNLGEQVAPTWTLFNSISGYSVAGEAGYQQGTVIDQAGADATPGVWMWVLLSDARISVDADALSRNFNFASREDGLDFDKFAFAPVQEELIAGFTVDQLDGQLPGVRISTEGIVPLETPLAGQPGLGGNGGETPAPLPLDLDFVEDTGAQCEVGQLPNQQDLANNSSLPDPFLNLNGNRISTRDEWTCRRKETLLLAERFLFGTKPGRPDSVTGTVSANSIAIEVSHQGQSTSFSVGVQLPDGGEGPFPALISYGGGFFGFSQNEVVRTEGAAIIAFDPYDVGSEEASRNNKAGAFYDIYGGNSSTGLLAAWAWGVSRIIDVIEASGGNLLRADAVGVAGCSRFGKGAITAGALDERVALTVPFESGSAGVPIWRGIPGEGAQSPGSAFGETYWLGDDFSPFTNSVNLLPIDTHQVLALVAPRGLLILDNPFIANLGPESAHVAALAGAEVYRALGAAGNIGYHSSVQSGSHCEARPEHVAPLQNAVRRHLLGLNGTAAEITARNTTTGNLAEWRDWDTPDLD